MTPPASSSTPTESIASSAWASILIVVTTLLLHASLLRLPYFWDEAGYYVPAARDLLLKGSLIPLSTPSNAHPPLVMAYLALWWKLLGSTQWVTRSAMLLAAAFALLGVFRLARRVAHIEVAIAATASTALYPVFFAQSTMAHVDLATAGLTIWGLDSYVGGRARSAALWFSLSVLAKETAILAPLALLAWEMVCPWVGQWFKEPHCLRHRRWPLGAAWMTPLAVLVLWYVYHYARTGYVFGNPEFFRYNVQATLSPLRILLALLMRLWQIFGYLHLWVLTLLMGWAMTRPALRDGDVERPRIELATQFVFGVVIVTYVAAMSVIGGAVLARYMLTVVPLVLMLAISTLRRRVRAWRWLVGVVCAAFVAALFLNPPYGFSLEDNLAYRDYILMHEDAAQVLQSRYPNARVLTAWPASDEISRPFLGYVTRPLEVVRIENFAVEEVLASAEERARFDVVLAFSTKYEPPHPVLESPRWWEGLKSRFFGYHRDLAPPFIAQVLNGNVVFRKERQGQWVAVIELERVEDARL